MYPLPKPIANLEVRDWFWERVHGCKTPLEFICFMGLGFEAANLEHSARFAGWFREGGDEAGAKILDTVERDEVKHVAFGRKWFEKWTGEELRFDTWRAQLPAPLTPSVFRGLPLNRKAREQAGLPEHFLRDLETYSPADQALEARNRD